MVRLFFALTLSLSLIALLGVGYILLKDDGAQDSGDEADQLYARIDQLEERLENIDAVLAAYPQPVQAAPASELNEAGVPDDADGGSTEGDAEKPATEKTVMARLESLEIRLRGLEEDPAQRAFTYLQSESAELRKRGVRGLEALARSDPEARAALREMLADNDAGVRYVAIETLMRINDKDAAADIAHYMGDENPKVRERAVDAMGRLGYKDAAEALAYALGDENPGVRREAIFSLAEVGAKEALPQLQAFYNNVTKETAREIRDQRYVIAHAMKRLGDPSAAQAEIVRLGETVVNGQNDRERGGALKAISWLGDNEPVAREILKKVVNDPNKWISEHAKRVLDGNNMGGDRRKRR